MIGSISYALNVLLLCQLQVFRNGTFQISALEALVLYMQPVGGQSVITSINTFLIAGFLDFLFF